MVQSPNHINCIRNHSDQDYDSLVLKCSKPSVNVSKDFPGIRGIPVSDTLAADNIIFVEMRPDVVRLVKGMPIQNVEWSSEGGMTTHYKVMTIQVPQIRSDYNGNCGVFHIA